MKILVVEDDKDIADSMQIIIRSMGHSVDMVIKPDDAVDKVNGYDLVILDIMMPGMGAKKFLDHIEKPKVLMCSALTEKDAEKSVPLDSPKISGFIAKPFDINDFREKIDDIAASISSV